MKRNLTIFALGFIATIVLASNLMDYEFAMLGGDRPWKTLHVKLVEQYGAGFANLFFWLMGLCIVCLIGATLYYGIIARTKANAKTVSDEQPAKPSQFSACRAAKRTKRFRSSPKR